MPHLRAFLDGRSDHEARRVDQAHQRQAMCVAQLHEACGLVGGISVNGAAQMQRVVGDDADGPPFNARECGVDASAKTGAQLKHAAHVGDAVNRTARVVDTQTIFRNEVAQRLLIWCHKFRHAPLEERQVVPRRRHRFKLIGHQNIDHAIDVLHIRRSDLLGLEHTKPAAFHHGRAAHADVRVLRGDDHVTAAQERRVARKTAACHHAHHRHLAVQPCKA